MLPWPPCYQVRSSKILEIIPLYDLSTAEYEATAPLGVVCPCACPFAVTADRALERSLVHQATRVHVGWRAVVISRVAHMYTCVHLSQVARRAS